MERTREASDAQGADAGMAMQALAGLPGGELQAAMAHDDSSGEGGQDLEESEDFDDLYDNY